MLDTPLPVRPSLARSDKALIKLVEFRSKGRGCLLEWTLKRIAWELEKRDIASGVKSPVAQFNNIKIEVAFLRAVAAYDPPDWGGAITLFQPALDRS